MGLEFEQVERKEMGWCLDSVAWETPHASLSVDAILHSVTQGAPTAPLHF